MSVSGSALMDSSVNIPGSMAAGSALNIGITVTALYCLVKCVILFFITNYFMRKQAEPRICSGGLAAGDGRRAA